MIKKHIFLQKSQTRPLPLPQISKGLSVRPNLQSSLNMPNKGNQHSLKWIRHKDARGRYSAIDAKVIPTDNQNV